MLKSERIQKQIECMEANNDGSLAWVDTIRELIIQLDEALIEEALGERGE